MKFHKYLRFLYEKAERYDIALSSPDKLIIYAWLREIAEGFESGRYNDEGGLESLNTEYRYVELLHSYFRSDKIINITEEQLKAERRAAAMHMEEYENSQKLLN